MDTKVNGKLYIVGEYQVLKSGGLALLYGINRYITFKIRKSDSFSYENVNDKKHFFTLDDNKIIIKDSNNSLVASSFLMIFKYLEYLNIDIKEFNLVIDSELSNNSGDKYGFGSSSAIITGIIKSVAMFHDISLSDDILFKLSVLAQLESNHLTSGGDLASSIYGGFVFYRRYNLKWLLKQKSFKKLLNKKWPKLKIVSLKSNLKFGAVWTKESYKTKELSNEISKELYRKAKRIVNKAYVSLIDNDYLELKTNIKQYQQWFEEVFDNSSIITPEITKTIEILNKYKLAGKISGAGGGDSVIFLYPDGYDFTNLENELANNNLQLVLFKEYE